MKVRESVPFFLYYAYIYVMCPKDTGCKKREKKREEKKRARYASASLSRDEIFVFGGEKERKRVCVWRTLAGRYLGIKSTWHGRTA